MAFQFPAAPTTGQIFSPVAGVEYKFNGTSWDPISTSAISQAQGDARYIQISTKAMANGVASLGGTAKVPIAQLPAGTANGVASLDGTTKVPIAQLPAGVANGVASLDSGARVPVAQMPSGSVLQIVTFALDAGSSTTNAFMTNITVSSKVVTPKSTTSTLIIEVTFGASCSNVAAQNNTGRFQIHENGVPSSAIYGVSSVSAAGGNGSEAPASIRINVPNAALTSRGYLLYALAVVATGSAAGVSQVWTITEVQN